VTREREGARQVIQVRGREVELPEGVSVVAWSLERSRRQNPRLRVVLTALRELEEVLDSHYFLLHCSPRQLTRIRDHVMEVHQRLKKELAPLLEEASCVPALERARVRALASWRELDDVIFRELYAALGGKGPGQDGAGRSKLATAAGRLFAFLQDTLGALMEGDPRSSHEADYFLSQRFARDVEETEALHEAVSEIRQSLESLGTRGPEAMNRLVERMEGDARLVATAPEWKAALHFLRGMVEELLPGLQSVLVMPGVRYGETKALDRLCRSLAVKALVFLDLEETYRRLGTSPLPAIDDLRERLARLLAELRDLHASLAAFIPAWLANLRQRRALILLPKRDAGAGGEDAPDNDVEPTEA